jgi:hypothetical protein
MGSRRLRAQILRATLFEIERGLFHVSYRTDTAEWVGHEMPAYQTGTSASDARQRIEARARGYGFESVVWDLEPDVPAILQEHNCAGPGIQSAECPRDTGLAVTEAAEPSSGRSARLTTL